MESYAGAVCAFVGLASACFAPQGARAQIPSYGLGTIVCQATATPASVDAAGTKEQVGDIVIICQNVPGALSQTPAAQAVNRVTINVSVSLNVNVANDVDFGQGADVTDALLLVNENDCASPSNVGSTFGGCGAPNGNIQDPQYGRLATANRLEWNVVDLPVPGASVNGAAVDCAVSPEACFPILTAFRITGVEANAAPLGLPGPGDPPTNVIAFVSVTAVDPTATISVQNNQLNVGLGTAAEVLDGPSDPSLVTGVVCQATATPLAVDAAGSKEQVGDVVVTCTNTQPVPPGSSVTLDIGLSLNTDVTNDPGTGPPILLVNENDCVSPAANGSTFGSCGAPNPAVQDPQIGVIDQDNRVVFRDVTFPVPDNPADPVSIVSLRIKGVHADVAALFGGGADPSTQVLAFLSIGISVTNNQLTVGAPVGDPAPPDSEGDPGLNVCQATAVPPVVRAEGIAELIGDVIVTCSNIPFNGETPAPSVVMDIFVSLNVNVTNNIGFGPGADISDAVLIVNENNCTSPAAMGGVFGSCGGTDSRYQDPQYGRLEAPNRLAWRSVVVPIAGAPVGGEPIDCAAAAGNCNPFVTTLRITSMRARASQLGIPDAATFPSIQVFAFVAMSDSSFSVQNNVLNLAVPILSLVSSSPLHIGQDCVGGSVDLPITIREGFATAFKTIGIPSFTPSQTQFEAGYFAPGSNAGGGASQSTRIGVYFADVPDGVRLTLPKVVVGGGSSSPGTLRLQWVQGANSAGEGGAVSSETDDLVLDSPGPGPHVFFYEVTSSNPFANESVQIPVHATWTAGGPTPGSVTYWTLLAPLSQAFEASFPALEPRFDEAAVVVRHLLAIQACPPPPTADLRIELDTSPNVAIPGRLLQVRARVTNDGPVASQSVIAAVNLPPDFRLMRAVGPCTLSFANSFVTSFTCNFGTIAPGAGVLQQFAGVVAAAPSGALRFDASTASLTHDPDHGNNYVELLVPLGP